MNKIIIYVLCLIIGMIIMIFAEDLYKIYGLGMLLLVAAWGICDSMSYPLNHKF